MLRQELEKGSGIDYDMPFTLGYTGLSDALLKKYIEDSAYIWEGKIDELPISTIGSTIGTHTGPGGICVSYFAL
jgi:fatty acid-binding protein DegV